MKRNLLDWLAIIGILLALIPVLTIQEMAILLKRCDL